MSGLALAMSCSALGQSQGYLPAPSGKASLNQRHWMVQAQRSDLSMDFDHSFETTPCPSPSEQSIIETCTVTVELKWKNDGGWNQGESADDVGDPDDFVLYWEGFGHWSLKTATRDGTSVLGGSSPEGSPFGNGTVDGLSMTVPNSFETGDSGPTTYEFIFEYVPSEECAVRPLKVSGHYIHKYTGSMHIRVKPSLSISAGMSTQGPSLSGSITLTPEWFFDKHAWQKQLFEPGGTDHKKTLSPDEHVVAHEGCCGKTYQSDTPSSELEMSVTDTEPGDSTTVRAVISAVDSPIQSVTMKAWSEDGICVGGLFYEPEMPLFRFNP